MDKKIEPTTSVELEAKKEPTLTSVKKGNFKDYGFDFDVECHVLDDEGGTAVISQRGMAAAIGLTDTSGSALPRFVSTKTMSKHVVVGLKKKIENPLTFKDSSVVAGTITNGFDVTDLIDVCKAILSAHASKELDEIRYANVIAQAQVLLNASAKLGIKGLVYAITGYDATREQVIRSFKMFVANEAKEYEKEFPNQLYAEWYRLYNLTPPKRNKPWKFKHLTVKQVYRPLANSNSEIYNLLVDAKGADPKNKSKRLFQFLEEVGRTDLRQHLGQLLGIARISKTAKEYERHFETLFGQDVQITFDDFLSESMDEEELTEFDKRLKQVLEYPAE
ncbi:MAG: P63C domain-containing protein [Oscillospiraceae bacterium]|nr:P63C domain-containing protein [Oscillospiraceae bacterium]